MVVIVEQQRMDAVHVCIDDAVFKVTVDVSSVY